MGCCGKKGSDDLPLKEIKPYSRRSCTDFLFLLLFLSFWGATGFFLHKAWEDGGDFWRVIRGRDMQGRVCGVDEGVKNKLFTAWPYPPAFDYTVCLTSCGDTLTDPDENIALKLKSIQIGYYCVPVITEGVSIDIKFSGSWDAHVGTRNLEDLFTARYEILVSIGVALVLALVYIFLVKHCAGCLVWGSVLLTLAGGGFLSYYFLVESAHSGLPDNDKTQKACKYVGIICATVTGLFLVVVFFLRTQIRIAVAVVKESAKVLGDVPTLLFWPLVPLVMGILYCAFWLAATLFVYSVGTDVQGGVPPYAVTHNFANSSSILPSDVPNNNIHINHTVSHEFDMRYRDVLWVHGFGLFWNAQFLVYFGSMVVAGTVADWYFSNQHERGAFTRAPLMASVCRTIRFHLGSIALGSLILAVVRFTRAVLMYLQKKFISNDPNGLQRCVLCLVHCCLKCLDCCLDKLSKNGFVWISIWGSSFCTGSCNAFALLWRNLGRVAAVNAVSVYLMTMGKFTVAGVNTVIFAFYLMQYDPQLISPILPCVVIFLLTWVTTSMFMMLFDTIVDATFMCFLVDVEHNQGGHMMASRGLQALVDKHSKASQNEAEGQYKRKNAYAPTEDSPYRRL